VTAYVEELAAAGTRILGDALVGVYPHGSLLLGGWSPDRSDIDVLVVVSRALTASEKSALAAAWAEESLPCPAVGLELSVVLDTVVADPTPRSAFELHVTTAPEDRKVVDGLGHPGDLDLVLHFAVCHALGHPGFPEVPRPMVLAKVTDELVWGAQHNPSE
jgi:predicted nucleotidyltransferase